MRIAHFISSHNESGGNIAAYNLWRVLTGKGHKIDVFTSSSDKKDSIDRCDEIVFHKYGSFLSYRTENLSFRLLYKPLIYDVDIVHLQSGISLALLAGFIYSLKKKKPFVITWHGDAIHEHGRYNGFIARTALLFYNNFFVDAILSRADAIISLSDSYVDESKYLSKYEDKINIVPNGICLEKFNIQLSKEECKSKLGFADTKIVLFVGSIHLLKGVDVLLKSIPKIIKHNKNAMFIFAGNGDIKEYEALSKKIEVSKYVKFVGYINEKKALYYNAADIFVLPSLTECFPLVNLEAMACGLPIVATNVGGNQDVVINGENGLLITPNNSEILSDAIISLLDDENKREMMGKIGKEIVINYTWDSIGDKVDHIYCKLLK